MHVIFYILLRPFDIIKIHLYVKHKPKMPGPNSFGVLRINAYLVTNILTNLNY